MEVHYGQRISCYFSYTKSAAYNKRQLTLDRTKLKIPMDKRKRDLFQPARRRRQTAMSGLVGNIQTHRQPKRIKANTAGSLKLGRLQIIVKYDAKPIAHTPSPVYLFRFMISMLRPKSTSRRLCLSWPNIKGDQLILCPDLFANLLTASCPCRCSVAMLC